jgi:N-acetylgalactosamine kinase
MAKSNSNIAGIILCGGRGTRMRSSTTHKVCFEIVGQPAICRLVQTCRQAGVGTQIVVVGTMAGQVIETVGRQFPDAVFAYQHEQKGTGHAAQIGAQALRKLGYRGPVLLTMGDKVMEPSVLKTLIEYFTRTQADLCFLTAPRGASDGAGRILTDPTGRVLGNLEVFDIYRARWFGELESICRRHRQVAGSKLLASGRKYFTSESKLKLAAGPLWELAEKGDAIPSQRVRDLLGDHPGCLQAGSQWLTADRIESQARTENVSVYVYQADALYEALDNLRADNAQGEYYLTDTIKFLAGATDEQGRPRFRVRQLPLDDPMAVMAFNSPDELLAIEDHLRRQAQEAEPKGATVLDRRQFRRVDRWQAMFDSMPAGLRRRLQEIYGFQADRLQQRFAAYRTVLGLFGKRFGITRPVCIVRAPGRVNLMGRHVDHQGGHVNPLAIDREVILVASPRDDDVIRLVNARPREFPDRQFRMSELLGNFNWDDWLSYVDSPQVRQLVRETAGDWGNYAKAAILRLQQKYHEVRIRGMDCAVTGDIPMAAGLSSSSAVLVAVAHAAVAINDFDLEPRQFVDLCGEGEWFVGSRGGAADHAAIRFGRRGSIAHVRFFPFEVEEIVELPSDVVVIIANSQIRAAKSASARDQFNQRVATYRVGVRLLREYHPVYAPMMAYLRDVRADRLGIKSSQIYEMIRRLPARMTRRQIAQSLCGQEANDLDRLWSSHADPGEYLVRRVVLYGIAECHRSRICIDMLKEGDLAGFGRLMRVSHDGDRVARFDAENNMAPYDSEASDSYLNGLIEDLGSEDPRRVAAAQIPLQPGGYACSLPGLDRMVDSVSNLPGVYGAQLSGAGLGGCIMVLADASAAERVERALRKAYYRPGGLVPQVSVCQPVEGSGLLEV